MSEFGTLPSRNAAMSSRTASGTVYRGSHPNSGRIFSLDTWYDRRSSVGLVTIRTSTPASLTGRPMSLKKRAASTPWRRTGWRVISLASSGVRHASSMSVPIRSSRYSGSERPACRMNQTGVVSGRPPR